MGTNLTWNLTSNPLPSTAVAQELKISSKNLYHERSPLHQFETMVCQWTHWQGSTTSVVLYGKQIYVHKMKTIGRLVV